MAEKSDISWTDATFNPWWGCTKVSPGCKHCYADAFSGRIGLSIWGEGAERRFFGDDHWNEPLAWNEAAKKEGRRKKVFAASMADVFEDRRDLDAWRERLWKLIEATPWLDWLLLTKRPENVAGMVPWGERWPSNVWLGTSVENQDYVSRIEELRQTKAQTKFLSLEPLLGPLPKLDLSGIDWVIVGGESGSKARPIEPAWVRDLRDQCQAAGVAFFFKQWGNWKNNPLAPRPDGKLTTRKALKLLDKGAHGGELLDGAVHHNWPASKAVAPRDEHRHLPLVA